MIWTHLYLSPEPLCAQDLIERLKVSKALVSLSIKDLLHYQVIVQTEETLNKKNKFYTANPDVVSVIRNVLESRETKMVSKLLEEFTELASRDSESQIRGSLSPERLEALGKMITGADFLLRQALALSSEDPEFISRMLIK